MSTFFLVCYVFTLILSVTAFFTGIYVGIKRIHTIRILPKALRLYLLTCCFPFFIVISVCSMVIAANYLLYNIEKSQTIEIFRHFTTFSSQQIRSTFILIMFERIIATIKLENHTLAEKTSLVWKMTIFSYIASAVYVAFTIYAKSMPNIPLLYNIVNYYAYCAHIFMFSVGAVLYLMNKRMYKLSAYKITLKKRYAISQNVKSLKYLFPTILIYAIFAQFASMINIIFATLNFPTAPVCIFHIFYNLPFLMIYLRHHMIHFDNKISEVKISVTTITNPLGKNIPIKAAADQYFKSLHDQWK